MAIIEVNLQELAPPVKNWRILLVQSFTARMVHTLADGNQRIQFREKTLELSSTVLSTLDCLRTFIQTHTHTPI